MDLWAIAFLLIIVCIVYKRNFSVRKKLNVNNVHEVRDVVMEFDAKYSAGSVVVITRGYKDGFIMLTKRGPSVIKYSMDIGRVHYARERFQNALNYCDKNNIAYRDYLRIGSYVDKVLTIQHGVVGPLLDVIILYLDCENCGGGIKVKIRGPEGSDP